MTWEAPKPFKWHYCGACGAMLQPRHDMERIVPYCAACNRFFYHNPVPACCVFVRDEQGALLFARRAMEPALGRWTLPGGFMEMNETSEECALRELYEETGLQGRSALLLGTSLGNSAIAGCVLVLGYVVDGWTGVPQPASDASALRFYAREERPDVPFKAHRELLALYDEVYGADGAHETNETKGTGA